MARENGVSEHAAYGDDDVIVSSIREVPVTEERKPYVQTKRSKLPQPGVPRANIAPTEEKPHGTTENDWAKKHSHQTVLQQHGDFFDRDKDGILWPQDTYIGFRRLGFNVLISFIAILVIHINFSYATVSGWMPDPFFRLFLNNAHKTKHGSDTGTFDYEGRFIPQRFEEIFTKYAEGREYLTLADLSRMVKGQRNNLDPIGWAGAIFEWGWTYIMLWPEDGRLMKEDIRGIFDGSIFYTIAARRENKKKQ